MRSVRLLRNGKAGGVATPLWNLSSCQNSGKRSLVTNKVENVEPDPYEGNFNFVDCDQYAKVTVIGAAGRVGRTLSLLLKTCPLIDHLCLFDTDKSVKGIGLDISHIDTKCTVQHVCGMRNIHQALDAPDVVVIAAGCPVSPELSRDRLFERNAPIVAGLSEACARFCPKACVVLITNPINSLLPVMGEVYQLINNRIPFRKLFGLTTLDVVRANTFVAEVVRKDPNSIIVPVVGGASQDTIVPVISQMKPCCKIRHGEQLALTECIKRAEENLSDCQNCGTRGASSLSTAYAAFRFTSSLVMALKGAEDIIECAYVKSDIIPELEYLASPLKLGIRGVEHNFGYPHLSDYEVNLMEQAAVALINDIDMGKCFVVEHQERQKKYFKRCSPGRMVSFFNELSRATGNQCDPNNCSAQKQSKSPPAGNSNRRGETETRVAKSPDTGTACPEKDQQICKNVIKYVEESFEENYIQPVSPTCNGDDFKDDSDSIDSAEDRANSFLKKSMQRDQDESCVNSADARCSCHECRNIKDPKICENLMNFMTKSIEENHDRGQNSKDPSVGSSGKWMESEFEICICPKEKVISENKINTEDKSPNKIAEPTEKSLKQLSSERKSKTSTEPSEEESCWEQPTYGDKTVVHSKVIKAPDARTVKNDKTSENLVNVTTESIEGKRPQPQASGVIAEQATKMESVSPKEQQINEISEVESYEERTVESNYQINPKGSQICESKVNQVSDSFEEKKTKCKCQSSAGCKPPQSTENKDGQERDKAIKPKPQISKIPKGVKISNSKMSLAIESEKRMKSKPQLSKGRRIREICENKINIEKVCSQEGTPTEAECDAREAPSTEEEKAKKPKKQYYRRCTNTDRPATCPHPEVPAKKESKDLISRKRLFLTSVHVKEIEDSMQDSENRTTDRKNNYRCRIKIEKQMKN